MRESTQPGAGLESATAACDLGIAGYRLLTYSSSRGERAGILTAGRVYDAADLTGHAEDVSVIGLLSDWDGARRRIEDALASRRSAMPATPLSEVALLAPIPVPGTIYGAGANYADHAREMANAAGAASVEQPKPDRSWHFLKSSRTVVGPGASVVLPKGAQKVDWEVELAAIIGRRGKNISVADALGHVAGYSVAIDLSARDLSRRVNVIDTSPFKMDWLAHKNFDGACPLGPWITPTEIIADPQALAISLAVNGEIKQQSTTAAMIFSIAEQIRDISERITLWPGDVILTGTPAGVGMSRGEFLKAGDVMLARIEGIGELTTTLA